MRSSVLIPGHLTKWPKGRWGPDLHQAAKGACDSADYLCGAVRALQPVLLSDCTYPTYLLKISRLPGSSPFHEYIHNIPSSLCCLFIHFTHHWCSPVMSQPGGRWRWCRGKKAETLPSKGVMAGELCAFVCTPTHCRAKQKMVQLTVRVIILLSLTVHWLASAAQWQLPGQRPFLFLCGTCWHGAGQPGGEVSV